MCRCINIFCVLCILCVLCNTSDSLNMVGCMDGFIRFENKCYKLVEYTKRTWQQAEQFCKRINSTLASIETEKQLQLLVNYITDAKVIPNFYADDIFWTASIKSEANNDIWKSSDKLPAPDLLLAHCARLSFIVDQFYLNEFHCNKQFKFICENVALEQNRNLTGCPEKFTRIGQLCYQVSYEKKDHSDSNFLCNVLEQNDAKLVEIQSNTEMNLINEYLLSLGFRSVWSEDGFWIQGKEDERRKDGIFRMPNSQELNYTKWLDGEPKIPGFNNYCLQLKCYDGEFYMSTDNCWEQHFYICEVAPEIQTVQSPGADYA